MSKETRDSANPRKGVGTKLLALLLLGITALLAGAVQLNWMLVSSSTKWKSVLVYNLHFDQVHFDSEGLTSNNVAGPAENLQHNHTDEELFKIAAATEPGPMNGTHKLAFLFLTRGPLPLAPIWERFFQGYEGLFSIYIHAPPGFVYDPAQLPKVFLNRQIPSKDVVWGDVSVVDAERRLLANALLDPFNKRFILVSESCIPLERFDVTYHHLIDSKYSFLESVDIDDPGARGRWSEHFLPDVPLSKWRKGQQWFELERRLVKMVVEDTKYHSLFASYQNPNCYIDEHYMPTMLFVLAASALANNSVTYTYWDSSDSHPHTFYPNEVNEELFQTLRKRDCKWNDEEGHFCVLFARKFAPEVLEKLWNLSNTSLGYL